MSPPAHPTAPLNKDQWQQRARAHTERIDALIGPYLLDRRRGRTHPVIDFLFTYYSARPAMVRRWHPGYGTALAQAPEYLALADYRCRDDGAAVVAERVRERRRPLIEAVGQMLAATASRPARFGCFGLHEWAMVYRTDTPRHALPLRLGAAGTDQVVESMPLRCTHYDAYRFFTPEAAPRNATALSRAAQHRHEQPGCLHATMDLYRYCLKLGSLIPGELLADAFELALDARTLDMQASPYDLTELGYPPVPIETPAGRSEYVHRQSMLSRRGEAVRDRLSRICGDLVHTRETGEELQVNPG
ncbi:hypothetical protein GOHSU_02_02000 [Gordonia hirsuta DSM 44140 = NBRC 16056]|uniref:3-methyladenine DNA glycosylase n=1 Tax=Gordonia hirsuta DSM 44140 = NBRC 16056 TaxID=1121927 RepID=L7L7R2_9ACTN|nr:hypothetical protein [Gordonia hirsuta]GAC56053.1 hypothetical protein GOHSU_02_02000 [Gordonia hirsuta DSM 44140 = NBRC 16056]